jgi:multidrug efflux system membrane fusion protein
MSFSPPSTEPDIQTKQEAQSPPSRGLSRRSKRISWVVAIIAIAAVLFLILRPSTESGDTGRAGGGRRGGPATTVGTAKAVARDVPVEIESLGTVTPAATVTVRPQVSGIITQVLFREGQMVKRGQVLAVIDPRAYRAALTQAEGAFKRDRATLENARLTLTRFRTLLSQDSIARQDVDTQAALVRQLEGTADVNRGAADAARLNVTFTNVLSPVDGRVGLRVVDVGNYIGAGDANGLVVVTTLSPIDVEFTVPQDQVPVVQQKIAANQPFGATVLDRTRTTILDRGVFLSLNNQVATDTGTVRAKARFPNSSGSLYPSQFVNLRLNVNNLIGAVTVPQTAVRQGTSGTFVWLLDAKNKAHQRKVVTGPAIADSVTITSGLKVGETVVTEGGDRLTEGGSVQTAATAAKAAARPAGGKGRRRRAAE